MSILFSYCSSLERNQKRRSCDVANTTMRVGWLVGGECEVSWSSTQTFSLKTSYNSFTFFLHPTRLFGSPKKLLFFTTILIFQKILASATKLQLARDTYQMAVQGFISLYQKKAIGAEEKFQAQPTLSKNERVFYL